MTKMGKLTRSLLTLIFFGAIFLIALGGYGHWAMTKSPLTGQLPAQVTVLPGDSVHIVIKRAQAAGVDLPAVTFLIWSRLSGDAGRLKAGVYEIEATMTPLAMLKMLVDGKSKLSQLTVVEGWTFQQMRRAIMAHPDLKNETKEWSEAQLLEAIGASQSSAEGLFFPDTYRFMPGTSDLKIYKLAYDAMAEKIEAGWAARDPAVPYRSPYEAIIMASIVEKETGHPEDRAKIAGVFVNRLRKNMRLQSDPTVIYGMKDKYRGNLGKVALRTDSPYNTYTRSGLPPTPIALPSFAALQAVLRPATTSAMYFVAAGDGTGRSRFNDSLDGHNIAVREYWQRQRSARDAR